MFFIGIFGIESKEKEIRDINNVICKACGRMTSYKLIKTYNYFHIFFLPIYKWGVKYYLSSKCCGSIFELSKEQGIDLENGKDILFDNLDVKILEDRASKSKIVCYSCGREVEGNFQYCPHCGAKLK